MDISIFDTLESDAGKRLDVFVSESIEGYSRSYIKKIIDSGMVKINGNAKKSNYKLKAGERVEVSIPKPVKLELKAENIHLDIIYEDDHILIVNKPQNMVVHPAHGNYDGTLVNALLNHCTNLSGINGVIRPGIVHRIDKDTSGIIMVAKTNEAHMSLSQQLKEHKITREYLALLEGRVKTESGTIDAPIGRNPRDRKKMDVVSKNGKNAVTHFKVLETYESNTLIEAKLETGRTHQIRVHMAYYGHPVVGDMVYGYKKQRFKLKGQLLHAKTLGFIHPNTNEYMEFHAPLPDYFEEVLSILRKRV